MFKSIFTKYIAAFMSIIIVSFAVLAFIVGSMAVSHSVRERESITTESAQTVKDYLENEFSQSEANDMQLFIYYNHAKLRRTLTLFTSYEKDLLLLLADLEGNILITDKLADAEYVNAKIPKELVSEVISGTKTDHLDDFGGLFENNQIYTARPIVDKSASTCAVLFSISTDSSLTDLSEIITLFVGKSVTEEQRASLTERLEDAYPDCEINVYNGDQNVYDYVVAVE